MTCIGGGRRALGRPFKAAQFQLDRLTKFERYRFIQKVCRTGKHRDLDSDAQAQRCEGLVNFLLNTWSDVWRAL
jgi:hypothetical protein